jgi:6-phosphogluconate dehydrogenase
VDVVLDTAHQLGTGMWATQDALELHVPTPTIDTAVVMRNLSGQGALRRAISQNLGRSGVRLNGDGKKILEQSRRALYSAFILTYAQGFAQLEAASKTYQYNFNLSAVARIWRGGCIIRSQLLEPIREAYLQQPGLLNLLLDPYLGNAVQEHLEDLRALVQSIISAEIPAPAFMTTLSYMDSLQATHLPANLIQTQRDYFGAHTYERVDQRGLFHTQWSRDGS